MKRKVSTISRLVSEFLARFYTLTTLYITQYLERLPKYLVSLVLRKLFTIGTYVSFVVELSPQDFGFYLDIFEYYLYNFINNFYIIY